MKDLSARFYDLEAHQFEDGTVRLSQQSGIDDPSIIDLHPQQLIHVAEQLGYRSADRMTASIHRRLLELQSDLRYFTDHDLWLTEIAERLGDGLAFQIGAGAMRSAIDGIIADLGLVPLDAEPEQEPAESPEPAQKSDDIYQQDLELGGAS